MQVKQAAADNTPANANDVNSGKAPSRKTLDNKILP